jgi:hypothetical protein
VVAGDVGFLDAGVVDSILRQSSWALDASSPGQEASDLAHGTSAWCPNVGGLLEVSRPDGGSSGPAGRRKPAQPEERPAQPV